VKWFERSQDAKTWPDMFDRFIFLWIAFDAWASNESGMTTHRMINWVKTSKMKNIFKEIRGSIEAHLSNLSALGDIPNHVSGESVRLRDPHDFSQLLDVVYVIRNNLFHGHKSPDDQRDEELVTVAYDILSPLLRPFAEGLRINN